MRSFAPTLLWECSEFRVCWLMYKLSFPLTYFLLSSRFSNYLLDLNAIFLGSFIHTLCTHISMLYVLCSIYFVLNFYWYFIIGLTLCRVLWKFHLDFRLISYGAAKLSSKSFFLSLIRFVVSFEWVSVQFE